MDRYNQFIADSIRAKDIIGYGATLNSLTSGRIDGSDMYRAGLVQIVAALDAYVHGVILDGLVEVVMGRKEPNADKSMGLSFSAIQSLNTEEDLIQKESLARGHIAQRLSLETFQKPDDIAKALSIIGITKIWSRAFRISAQVIKTQINIIVHRRNQIVHQCDRDPSTLDGLIIISESDALDAVKFIQKVVRRINSVIKT